MIYLIQDSYPEDFTWRKQDLQPRLLLMLLFVKFETKSPPRWHWIWWLTFKNHPTSVPQDKPVPWKCIAVLYIPMFSPKHKHILISPPKLHKQTESRRNFIHLHRHETRLEVQGHQKNKISINLPRMEWKYIKF
jgi:hypothetical protein